VSACIGYSRPAPGSASGNLLEANFSGITGMIIIHLDLGFPCNLLGSRTRGCDVLYAKDPRDPLQPLGYFARDVAAGT
jgi:hypothetical protein